MALDQADCEGVADFICREAGMAPEDVWRPMRIARAWQGADAIRDVPNLRHEAQLCRVHGLRVIAVRQSLAMVRKQFAVAHELAHLGRELLGIVDDEYTEQECDYVAAALVLRRRPFVRRASHEYTQLALDFKTSETAVALRVGEVLNEPVAVVAPHAVRARGEGWRDDATVRGYARRPPPGLVKVRLQDDTNRVALHA